MTNKPKRDRRIRVRAIKRTKPDLRKLGRAMILLAQLEQARDEKEAEAQQKRRKAKRG